MTTTQLTDQQPADTCLASAAQRALESLDMLIAEHSDPGTEALGARYCLSQELTRRELVNSGEAPATVDAVLAQERRKAIAAAFEQMDARQWGYDHGFCAEYGVDPETDSFVDAALAVVQPELDRSQARAARFRDAWSRALDREQQEKARRVRAEAELGRAHAELATAREQADAEPALCADCGHVAAAHSDDGERACTASGARVTSCSCSYFIPAVSPSA